MFAFAHPQMKSTDCLATLSRFRSPLSLAVVGLALVGCTVGPNHQTPTMELPTSFATGGVKWKRTSEPKLYENNRWWRVFSDSTLNELAEATASRNYQLESAAATLREARAMSRGARSRFFPTISFNPSYTNSQMRAPGSGNTIRNEGFSLPVDLDWELDLWGKVRRQVEGAKANEQAAEASVAAMRLSLTAETAFTYWALRGVDSDRAILRSTVELRNNALGLLREQMNAGAISQLDVSRAETEVATAEADLIGLDRTRAELVSALAVLTGRPSSSFKISEKAELPDPPSIPSGVPSDLLLRRPDLYVAERRVAATNAEIGVTQAAFYPSVRISMSGGLDSATWGNLFDAQSKIWSIGPSISQPIATFGRLQADRDAAIARHDQASLDYKQSVLTALKETDDSLRALEVLRRQQGAQEKAVSSSGTAFNLSKERFTGGIINFLDVVDAERTRLNTLREANALRAERLGVTVTLIKALGGSW